MTRSECQRFILEAASGRPWDLFMLEAGTGVGKTAVYLELARQAMIEGRRAVVSVPTRVLMRQVMDEARRLSGFPDPVVLCGRENYVSPARLAEALSLLSDEDRERLGEEALSRLRLAADDPTAFLTSSLGRRTWGVWDLLIEEVGLSLDDLPEVLAASFVCIPRGSSKTAHTAYYDEAVQAAVRAPFVVTNHYALFTRLARNRNGKEVLGSEAFLVFDETHTLPEVFFHVCSDAVSLAETVRALAALARLAAKLRATRTLAPYAEAVREVLAEELDVLKGLLAEARLAGRNYAEAYGETALPLALVGDLSGTSGEAERRKAIGRVCACVELLLLRLCRTVEELRASLKEVFRAEGRGFLDFPPSRSKSAEPFAETVREVLERGEALDRIRDRRFSEAVFASFSPVEFAPSVGVGRYRNLFRLLYEEGTPRVVLVSATLFDRMNVGRSRRLAGAQALSEAWFLRRTLGLDALRNRAGVRVLGVRVPSPWAGEARRELRVKPLVDWPEAFRAENALSGAAQRVADEVIRVAEEVAGGVLVLFTSYEFLERVLGALAVRLEPGAPPRLGERPVYAVLSGSRLAVLEDGDVKSGPKMEHRRVVSAVLEAENAILMATAWAWQGLDVPGRALSAVVVTKLPYRSYDDPFVRAVVRAEGHASTERKAQLSRKLASFTLRQGVGRLVRRPEDEGLVVVLDARALRERNLLEACAWGIGARLIFHEGG